MSKIKKDKLEEFFDSRIKKQTGSEGWNLPSDDIFMAAMDTIDEQNAERKTKWLAMVVAAAFVIGLSTFLFFSNQDSTQDADVIASEIKAVPTFNLEEISQSEHGEEISDTENSEKQEVVKQENSQELSSEIQGYDTPHTSRTNNHTWDTDANSFNKTNANQFVPVNTQRFANAQKPAVYLEEKQEEIIKSDVQVVNDLQRPVLHEVDQLSLLKRSSLSVHAPGLAEAQFARVNQYRTDSSYKVFAQSSLFQSSIFMKDIATAAFTLDGYERFSTGFSLGLGVQKNLNGAFHVEAVMNWMHFTNASLYISEFQYDKTHEYYTDGGDLMYHHDMVVSTPRARIAMSDEVHMDYEMNDNDVITNKTEIVESYDVIQFGIGLHYELLNTGKLSIDLGFTPGVNYIFNDQTGLNTILETDKQQRMAEYETSVDDMDVASFNSLYFDLQGSVRVNYALSDNWSLRLSGLYGQSLNSIKKYDSLDSTKSYFKTRSVALGLAYRF